MLEEEKKEELLALLTGKKYRELKSQLVEMNEVDIASFIEELDSEKTVVVFRMLPKELASEVFACLEVEQQQHIITSITDNELRAIIDDLYVDDAVDMLEELPATIVRRVLQNSSPDTRKLINQFLNYPENSAGSVMTAEYVGLKKNMTVEQAFAYIRKYGVDKETAQKVMVYDLGGGTFDVSIIEMGDGVTEVLATNGDTHLGGDDFDQRIIDWMADAFQTENGIDLRKDKMAAQRLKEAAEKAKIELSSAMSSQINLPFITADATGPKHLDMTLTRAKFNELTADLVDRTMTPVRKALQDAGLRASDLKKVLMVGGSTRIPAVYDAVKKELNCEPFKGINPDECVAVGAAIQGGVLNGEKKGLLLLDVTPLSLGIETLGGVCTKIIDRNTTIPTHKSQVFSTAADNQPSVEVNVLQGEREFARDNKSLGVFHLDGIAPAPRGVPQIEVTFDIDANGIVKVSAKDLGTGKEQNITITASTNMSKEDIDKAVKEAEQFAADDKKKREEVDIRNGADQMVFQTEKMLKENGDKLPADVKSDAEAKLADLKTAVQSGNVDDIKAKQEALSQVFEKMYQAAAAAQQAAGAQPGADAGATNEKPNDDGVVDADFKEV